MFVSTSELAKRAGVSVPTLRRLHRAGAITPAEVVAGRLLWPVSLAPLVQARMRRWRKEKTRPAC